MVPNRGTRPPGADRADRLVPTAAVGSAWLVARRKGEATGGHRAAAGGTVFPGGAGSEKPAAVLAGSGAERGDHLDPGCVPLRCPAPIPWIGGAARRC